MTELTKTGLWTVTVDRGLEYPSELLGPFVGANHEAAVEMAAAYWERNRRNNRTTKPLPPVIRVELQEKVWVRAR